MPPLLAAEALLGHLPTPSLPASAVKEHLQWQAPAAAQAVPAQSTAGLPPDSVGREPRHEH
jgi:hypothetical protein